MQQLRIEVATLLQHRSTNLLLQVAQLQRQQRGTCMGSGGFRV